MSNLISTLGTAARVRRGVGPELLVAASLRARSCRTRLPARGVRYAGAGTPPAQRLDVLVTHVLLSVRRRCRAPGPETQHARERGEHPAGNCTRPRPERSSRRSFGPASAAARPCSTTCSDPCWLQGLGLLPVPEYVNSRLFDDNRSPPPPSSDFRKQFSAVVNAKMKSWETPAGNRGKWFSTLGDRTPVNCSRRPSISFRSPARAHGALHGRRDRPETRAASMGTKLQPPFIVASRRWGIGRTTPRVRMPRAMPRNLRRCVPRYE